MAKLVFGMNQSLDGYVDHTAFASGPTLFRHFIEEAEGQAGSAYGRKMYEIMRYSDDDHPEWGTDERAFASAWRRQPKWVVSRSMKSVGPNATLVEDDLDGAIRALKTQRNGEIEVAGPDGAKPHRAWPHRRIPDLPAPRRARSRHAVFRRTPAAAPPRDA